MMIKREISKNVIKLAKDFPVVIITGARQTGKTTIIKKIFPTYKYFNLEDPDIYQSVSFDPSGFISDNQENNIIIDEAQKLPILFSYIQARVDEKRENGKYIISGSENILLSDKVNQSLAGRAAYIDLFPLSISELKTSNFIKKDVFTQIYKGGYPQIYADNIDISSYYNQYIRTYLERDVRNISNISSLSQFQMFMSLLSGRIGQLFNASALANEVGVSATTITQWLSILEASYIVFRLQPYYKNFGKRNTKSSKIYFYDTGLACRLLNIDKKEELDTHFQRGGLFENFCILEIKKNLNNKQSNKNVYFFRDNNGNEVDLIIDLGNKFIPIEIKASKSFNISFLKGLIYWQNLTTSKKNSVNTEISYLLYNGNSHKLKNVNVVNVMELDNITKNL